MNKELTVDQIKEKLKDWYKTKTGEILNLENPQKFSEKIQWLKIYDSTLLKTKLADKFLVREWIEEKIGEEYLIPLLGVWDSFEDIDFESLPNQFVLKANHGSGWNIIVKEKAKLNRKKAEKKFAVWMKTNFAYGGGFELHYKDIEPKIIAEKYMEMSNGELTDYKVHCYNGEPKYIQCMTERASHATLREKIYDLNWKPLPFTQNYIRYDGEISRPQNLEKLIQLAKILCKDFYYVRVDFYSLDDGSLKFGEMTFTPGAGIGIWNIPEYNLKCGQLLHLPENK